MNGPPVLAAAWLYLCCFGMAVASAVLPWLNAEVIVLSLAAMAHSRAHLAAIALLATLGQVTGKSLMYWTARRAGSRRAPRGTACTEAWRQRLERHSAHPFAWTFISAVVGVPPLYVVTLLAGLARVPFGRFLLAATMGRLMHFGALVLLPQLAW